ncbi:MAG: type secretory pathway, VirJ component [Gammaproteobacteria bacterium]|nr:type secretory pathway, VirJ component [Gammaproteobacteria bacterium]
MRTPVVPRVASPSAWTPISQHRLSHGRFANFTVYAPSATPKGFVLLLSGADGWNQRMSDMASRLAEQGAMVAGIDVAQLNASFEADGAGCVFPDGDLENLSHFVQAFFRLPTYLSPVLSGYSAGATLAYAALAQAPTNTFAGAVSLQFCPSYPLHKPFCKGSGIDSIAHTGDGGVDFLPAKRIGSPWIVVQTQSTSDCGGSANVGNFVTQVPDARLVTLSNGENPMPAPPQFLAAIDTLMARDAPASAGSAPSALGDLPIVTVAAQAGAAPSDMLAIMLSGDGGWAGLDKEVAGALTANGIPVVGLDSLRYFWSPRTPDGVAMDLERTIRFYLAELGKSRVILIGYSQGADVLPFAVNRLSSAIRSKLALVAVMGMSEHALFEFHLSSWMADDNSGPATLPEVERITGEPVLCIYGDQESDSLCPKLDPRKITIVKLKGGHHFDGDYAGLARTILVSARR